jgi:hypothetical protein
VVLVSGADTLHNAGAVLSDYRELGDKLWKRFNPDAGKAGTIGYYRGLLTAYQTAGHQPGARGSDAERYSFMSSRPRLDVGAWPAAARLMSPLSP